MAAFIIWERTMRWQKAATSALNLLIGIASSSATAFAAEQWTQFGLRPLAMGNAYVAVADDFNSLFYNPAGLARLEAWDGEFLNPRFTLSTGVRGVVDDVQNLTGGSSVSNTLDLIEKYTGESYHIGLGLTPHLIFPGFGFAVGLDFGTSILFHREISVDLDAGLRGVVPIAFAMNFFDKKLSVGFGVKARARAGVSKEFSMEDIQAFQKSNDDTSGKKLEDYVLGGVGAGADIGILFTPTKTLEPTLGLSITDIGGTAYQKVDITEEAVGRPDVQLPSVNIGMSLKPYKRDWLYLLTSADMHSVNQPTSFSKKLSLGTELGLGSVLRFQAGLYHGYLTAGMQFDVGLLNLRIMTYAEELGSVAGFKEDRRVALQLKLLI